MRLADFVLRPIATWFERLVSWSCRRPRMAALVILAASLPAGVVTARFFGNVHAGLEDLLPRSAPAVRALEELHGRLGGQALLAVIVQSRNVAENHRFVDRLEERLVSRRIPEARSIQGNVRRERAWVRNHAPLLIPRSTFDSVADELDRAVAQAKADANPFYVDIGDHPADVSPWKELEARLETEVGKSDRFPNGYMETPDGQTVVVLLSLRGSEVELEPATRLLTAVREEVAALRPAFPSDMTVAYNGEVANLIEEHEAVLADLSLSSILVFALVGALLTAYFRSLRAILVVAMALLPGLVFTFAIGRFLIGHLNSNTAFLGSIIAGNGINFPIVLLAYYRARPRSEPMALAIVRAGRQALPGTLGAAATASAAYGGLAASTFKGFSQFGWLGGVGMVVTWAIAFLVTPAAIALLNPPRHGEGPTRAQSRLLAFLTHPRWPRLAAGSFVVLALFGAATGGVMAWRDGLYEMDLRALRNRESLRSGSASWDLPMNEVFGIWLNPVVGLVENPEQRELVARELSDVLTEGDPPVAERVETIAQFVAAPTDQEDRLSRLRRLAPLLGDAPVDGLSPRVKELIDAWFAPGNLRPVTPSDVPEVLRQPLTELSGRTDRVVLVYPSLRINYNDARNILRFVDRLSEARLPEGTTVGGGFLFMAEIIRLIRSEAPRVVLVVCVLVALALVPVFFRRPGRVPLVVVTVAAVAVVAQSTMIALGVRLNLLNFAAVPITIGVGADYAVNLFGAMDALGVDARRACARMGGAILLCSLTTAVGYVSLVVAESGALRSFGWAAVLGELMAVITVLLVLPVLLRSTPSISAADQPRSAPSERRA